MDHQKLGEIRGRRREEGGEVCSKLAHNDSVPRLTAVTWRGSCSSSESGSASSSETSPAPGSSRLLAPPRSPPLPSLLHSLTYSSFSPSSPLLFYPRAPLPVDLNVSVQVEIIHANQRHWLPVLDSQRELSFRRSLVHSCSSHYIFPYCRTAACIQWLKGLNLLQLLPGFTYNFL